VGLERIELRKEHAQIIRFMARNEVRERRVAASGRCHARRDMCRGTRGHESSLGSLPTMVFTDVASKLETHLSTE
jgi:hypothetical protein